MARISVNKLGEYLVQADSARRRRIIIDQKRPSDTVVAQYRSAVEAIEDFLTSGRRQTQRLLTHATRLSSDTSGTQWAVTERKNAAAALEAFVDLVPQLPQDVTFLRGPSRATPLTVATVAISVQPNFIIHGQRAGVPLIGAVKLHFPKAEDRALGKTGSEAVAVLLQQWLTASGTRGRRPAHQLCLSVDVFRKTIYCAPAAQTRRLERIEAACEEIAARWPQL